MYLYKVSVVDVIDFLVLNDLGYVLFREKFVEIDVDGNEINLCEFKSKKQSKLYLFLNTIYWLCDFTLYQYDIRSKTIESNEVSYESIRLFCEEHAVVLRRTEGKRVLGLFSLLSFEEKESIEIGLGQVYCSSSFMIFKSTSNNEQVKCFRKEDFTDSWVLDLNIILPDSIQNKSMSSSNFMFFEDRIIIHISGGYLVCIDLCSKKLLWLIEGVSIMTILEGTEVYNLDLSSIKVINVLTGEIKEKHPVSEEYSQFGIEIGTSNSLSLNSNNLFFTDNWRSKIGMFSLTDFKIRYTTSVSVASGVTLPNCPLFGQNSMFILDSCKTLHIFERE